MNDVVADGEVESIMTDWMMWMLIILVSGKKNEVTFLISQKSTIMAPKNK